MLTIVHILLASTCIQASPAPPSIPDPPDKVRESEDLRIEIIPMAWFPRLLGTYAIGPDGTELDVETDTYLHESELAFSGELDCRFDEWTFRMLGTTFSTSGSGVLEQAARVDGSLLAPGDDWSSEYAQWSIGAELDYALWRPFADRPFSWSDLRDGTANSNAEGDYLVDFRLSPRIGLRYLQVNQTFRSNSGGVDYEHDAGVAALILGALIEVEIDTRPVLPLVRSIAIEAGGTVSPLLAGGSGYLSSIEASLRAYLTPNASIALGFRLQGTSFTSEEYERVGSVMGLVGGVSLRF